MKSLIANDYTATSDRIPITQTGDLLQHFQAFEKILVPALRQYGAAVP